mmetsp:Transcript_31966/g.107631  ORF Transcript_31966/g.107631 Transcript_31966/m.107631 type:complete len:287 (+) Transcript_31966:810-1670(+)
MTIMPAPSPMTKPPRPASNGLEACVGSSLYAVHMAFIAPNPPYMSGVMAASAPPQTTTSASPRCTARIASPMACVPAAHAETTPKFGPRQPSSMATTPDAELPSMAGIAKGETFFGPRSCMRCISASTVAMPPNADPIMTPTRSPSTPSPTTRPASSVAMRAAAMARCVYRSFAFAVLGVENHALASKPLICAPTCDWNLSTSSKHVTFVTPVSPARTRCQRSSWPTPTAVTQPKPVTTTVRSSTRIPMVIARRSGALRATLRPCAATQRSKNATAMPPRAVVASC